MTSHLVSMLDRAEELFKELESEYKDCLKDKNVTERARNLTHEVLDKLRSTLDHAMRIAWEKYIAPKLSEKDKERARIYFPISSSLGAFRSTLGRGFIADLDKVNKKLYDFLLRKQPFTSRENQWLDYLGKIAVEGKHVRLAPQKRSEAKRIKVARDDGGSVSWDTSSVKFRKGVSIMGAPVDPETQRIVPTPGVTEQLEIWVSFILEGYGINALQFCNEACQKTRMLINEMLRVI